MNHAPATPEAIKDRAPYSQLKSGQVLPFSVRMPCLALPGTAAKLQVLCDRAGARAPLHVRGDVDYTGRNAALVMFTKGNFKRGEIVAGDEIDLRPSGEPHYTSRFRAGRKRPSSRYTQVA